MAYLINDIVKAGVFIAEARARGGEWTTGITAGTTQTQAGATALTTANNVIGTCANANDGVKLPIAGQGGCVFVRNDGAQTAKVYPPVGGAINGGSANAAVTLAAGASTTFYFSTDINCYQ